MSHSRVPASQHVTPDQWAELQPQLDALLDTAPDQRAPLFDALCGGDAARRAALEWLLAECERERPLLNQPAAVRFAELFVEQPVPFPPSLAARYRLTKELGRGGMAVVYLAQDLKHGRHVALKVVRPELASALGRTRFLREIAIAAQLHHPHIVPLYDSGEADGLLYYVMPYEPGHSLRGRMCEAPLSISEAVLILRDVCDALAHAHQHGIVHRDIKPDNVLLSGRHAMVSDFGVARALTEATGEATHSTAGIIIGTPAYMAPEQIAGDPHVDHRADIYAFGVLAYELLAGQPPFIADTPQLVLSAHLTQVPEPLTSRRPEVPTALGELVMKCLEKRSGDRWQNAEEILTRLQSLAAHGGVVDHVSVSSGSRPPTLPRSPSPPRQQWHRRAGAAVGLASLGALVWVLQLTDRPTTQPSQAVAVLVFQHGDTPELQSLAIGLTSSLIGALGRVPRLDVRSMDAVWPYRAGLTPVDSIRRTLNVRWLVGGRIIRLANQIVVTADLTDAGNGRLIDSRRATAIPGDAVGLIEDLVVTVATMLRERIGEQVRLQGWRAGTRSDVAFNGLNRAHKLARDADFLAEAGDITGAWLSLRRADSALADASRAAPEWEAPLVQRAWVARKTAFLLSPNGVARDSVAASIDRGLRHSEAALRLRRREPHALEAHGMLLHAKWALIRPADSAQALLVNAEKLLTDAINADTSLARALKILGWIHFHRGEFDQARLMLARAYTEDPYAQDRMEMLSNLFLYSFEEQEDAEARRWCTEYGVAFRSEWFAGSCRLQLMGWDEQTTPHADSAWLIARRSAALAEEPIRGVITAQLEMLVAATLSRVGLADSGQRVVDRVRARSDTTLDQGLHGTELLDVEASVRVRLKQPGRAMSILEDYLSRKPDRGAALVRSRRFRDLPIKRLVDALGRVP